LGWEEFLMKRSVGFSFFLLVLFLAGAGTSSATTYYIAATGSDSNAGTSKASPWLHAPGMVSCSANCAAHTPQSGDSFIFRGGDTWHFGNSSASPYAGAQGGWNWTWSGSAGSPIYIGVDQTWYAGASWTRPVLDGDNPTSTSFVSSCAHPFNSNPSLVNFNSSAYWQWDNFELRDVCWTNQVANAGFVNLNGGSAHDYNISNFYCHGWTMSSGAYDNYVCIQNFGGGLPADNSRVSYSIFDGSDSPHFPANSTSCQWEYPAPCASGQAIQGRMATIDHNVFRYLSNMVVTENTVSYHDNLVEYLQQTFASGLQQHGNVINELGCPTGSNNQFYNNVIRNTYSTQLIYLAVCNTAYVFGNVFYNDLIGYGAGGCLRLNSVSNSASTQTAYIYNNTFGDTTCQFKFEVSNSPLTPWNGTGNFANNHFIGFTNLASFYICNTGGMCAIHDNGNEVYQTTSVAASQGYTAANNYAPTLITNSTVVATGANLTGSCSAFSADNELCMGTSDAITESSGVAVSPAIPMVPRPSSGNWNVGAYQFNASLAGQPNPPTGLAAVAQ
jgi:hypothetical protein